jgi:hypothetical protein
MKRVAAWRRALAQKRKRLRFCCRKSAPFRVTIVNPLLRIKPMSDFLGPIPSTQDEAVDMQAHSAVSAPSTMRTRAVRAALARDPRNRQRPRWGKNDERVRDMAEEQAQIDSINAIHDRIVKAMQGATKDAVEAGNLLTALKKEKGPYGEWVPLFNEGRFNFKIRCGQNYMRLAKFAVGHPEVLELGLMQAYLEAGVFGKKSQLKDLSRLLGFTDEDITKAMGAAPAPVRSKIVIDGDKATINPTAGNIAAIISALTSNVEAMTKFLSSGKSFVFEIRKA